MVVDGYKSACVRGHYHYKEDDGGACVSACSNDEICYEPSKLILVGVAAGVATVQPVADDSGFFGGLRVS